MNLNRKRSLSFLLTYNLLFSSVMNLGNTVVVIIVFVINRNLRYFPIIIVTDIA